MTRKIIFCITLFLCAVYVLFFKTRFGLEMFETAIVSAGRGYGINISRVRVKEIGLTGVTLAGIDGCSGVKDAFCFNASVFKLLGFYPIPYSLQGFSGRFGEAKLTIPEVNGAYHYSARTVSGDLQEPVFENPDLLARPGLVRVSCVLSDESSRRCSFEEVRSGHLSLKSGVTMQGITARGAVEFDGGRSCVVIESAAGILWDGKISTSGFATCDSKSPQTIALSDINIALPVATFFPKRLTATGIASLKAPLVRAASGWDVRGGTFEVSKEGGTIQYLDETESLPEIARKALRDFHYSALSGTFDIRDGVLTASVHVEGRSKTPGVDRPVILNLKWEENIGALLRVINIGNDLERTLKEQNLL